MQGERRLAKGDGANPSGWRSWRVRRHLPGLLPTLCMWLMQGSSEDASSNPLSLGGGSNNLYFYPASGWCQCRWSMDLALSCKVYRVRSVQFFTMAGLCSATAVGESLEASEERPRAFFVLRVLLLCGVSLIVGTVFLVPRCSLGNLCALVLILFLGTLRYGTWSLSLDSQVELWRALLYRPSFFP